MGYAWGEHAPQINRDKFADYLCGHHMLLSHAAAYHLYNEKYRNTQHGEVGICLDTNFYYPMNVNVTQEYIDKAVNFKVSFPQLYQIFLYSIFNSIFLSVWLVCQFNFLNGGWLS